MNNTPIGPSQLLFAIVTQEENHDLNTLVKRVQDECSWTGRLAQDCGRMKWNVDHELKIIDFLRDCKKESLFIAAGLGGWVQVAFHATEIDTDGRVHPSLLSYLVKMDSDCLITPHNWHRIVHRGSLDPSQLPTLFTRVATQLQQLTITYKYYWPEFHHLLELNLLKQRLLLVDSSDDAVLVAPILCHLSSSEPIEDDEDTIELFEKLVEQWISVINYNVRLRDYSQPKGDIPIIKDEIYSQTLRRDVLGKLCGQLEQEDYQTVAAVLRSADSVLGDELDNLHITLKEEFQNAKLTVRYLSCLEKPLEGVDRIKSTHLMDVPSSYREVVNRVIIVVKHAGYNNREAAASRLLFMVANQIVNKCRLQGDEVVDELIKGHPHQCMAMIQVYRRCLLACIDTYHQVFRWQRLPWDLDSRSILSNFYAMDLRIGHIIEICQSIDQLGRYGDGYHRPITFSVERERDIGQSLRRSQKKFVHISDVLISENRAAIFDIHHPDAWYQPWTRFQNETRAIEIRLVHALELAVNKCSTLSAVCDILLAFKHLYPRPLFASVIDSTANQLFKNSAKEAKNVCSIEFGDTWNVPITATMTTHYTRMAVSAQRARGNIDHIARLIHLAGWAGSCSFQDKALHRCQQGHRLLGDFIRKEFAEWCLKLQEDVIFNTNAALQKMVIRRHIQRPDWIQPNLEGIVFQAISASGDWDRLLIEQPHAVAAILQERQDIQNLHGSLTTFCYYYNSIIKGLAASDKEKYRTNILRLEKTVQPGLIKITWKQGMLVKKLITNGYIVIEELIQLMSFPEEQLESSLT